MTKKPSKPTGTKRAAGARFSKPAAKKTAASKSHGKPTRASGKASDKAAGATVKGARATSDAVARARRIPVRVPGLSSRGAAPASRREPSARHKAACEAAQAAIDAALDKKAFVPVLLDVAGQASYTDFIGILSGRSERQIEAIGESVAFAMKERGYGLLGREGSGNGRWTLLDFGDVVVHIFYHPVREVYDIEGLWMDAARVPLDVPAEAMQVTPDALYGA